MNKYLISILILVSISIFGQTKYEIKDFSEKYIGILTIDKGFEDEVFKKGEISIFKKDNKESIIKINSEEFTFDLDTNGNIQTNVLELPYGEQSIIIYQDFNFDGLKDLAIMDGQYSCYHGPSFQIYLESETGLKHSAEFTRLAQEYCGMFQIDYKTKTINTMTKSGCCWHQFSTFEVKGNKPIAMRIVENGINSNGITEDYVEKNRVGNKMVEEKHSYLTHDVDIIEVYSLTFKNEKQMVVYRALSFEDYLFYIFIDKNSKIELMYTDEFVYNKKEQTLTFTNKDITYQINKNGIIVNTPKKKINMKAVSVGENTTLSSLSNLTLKNLTIE
ncbi:XAC2610-related protein [Flavobacterium sp.]|uniref:XAC2610-related protein n=1 Tax=Flavobacterium sp. TaxID=239 RepID=UPI004047C8ED